MKSSLMNDFEMEQKGFNQSIFDCDIGLRDKEKQKNWVKK
jgi:hypothetical protein